MCIEFAGPLPRTNVGNQYLIVAVEQISKWLVAWAIPTELLNSLGVMKFVKKEIILDFGPTQYILSDNELNFDCKAVQDLLIDSTSSGSANQVIIHRAME